MPPPQDKSTDADWLESGARADRLQAELDQIHEEREREKAARVEQARKVELDEMRKQISDLAELKLDRGVLRVSEGNRLTEFLKRLGEAEGRLGRLELRVDTIEPRVGIKGPDGAVNSAHISGVMPVPLPSPSPADPAPPSLPVSEAPGSRREPATVLSVATLFIMFLMEVLRRL